MVRREKSLGGRDAQVKLPCTETAPCLVVLEVAWLIHFISSVYFLTMQILLFFNRFSFSYSHWSFTIRFSHSYAFATYYGVGSGQSSIINLSVVVLFTLMA